MVWPNSNTRCTMSTFTVTPAKAGVPAGDGLGDLHPLGSQPSLGRQAYLAAFSRPGASAFPKKLSEYQSGARGASAISRAIS